MPSNNKFAIKYLQKKKKFESAAPIVINDKLAKVMIEILRYQKDESVENLHKMRIAFRRLRYALEIFSECFDETLFKKLYKRTRKMQDLLGSVRDIDVLEEKVRFIEKKEGLNIPQSFYQNIILEKTEISSGIKTELIKFARDKDINQFITN